MKAKIELTESQVNLLVATEEKQLRDLHIKAVELPKKEDKNTEQV